MTKTEPCISDMDNVDIEKWQNLSKWVMHEISVIRKDIKSLVLEHNISRCQGDTHW